MHNQTFIQLNTSINSGAIALIQLYGVNTKAILKKLTAKTDYVPNKLYLCQLSNIDEGMIVTRKVNGEDWVQIMPHGGPRVVQRLLSFLLEAGASMCPSSTTIYPEASTEIENDMLHAMAIAASAIAIEYLAAQPEIWKLFVDQYYDQNPNDHFNSILKKSKSYDNLIYPPRIVIVGKPNVGKSTLSNFVTGKNGSIVADLPGTTRDWVAGLTQINHITVEWIDTPGVHLSVDQTEQNAISLAKSVISNSDIVICIGDEVNGWLLETELDTKVDLWVKTKSDIASLVEPHKSISQTQNLIHINGINGDGTALLFNEIRDKLNLKDTEQSTPWAFNEKLVTMVKNHDIDTLKKYISYNR